MASWTDDEAGVERCKCDVRHCKREGVMRPSTQGILVPPRGWLRYERHRPIAPGGFLIVCDWCVEAATKRTVDRDNDGLRDGLHVFELVLR